jgi:hypothetical protein
VIGVARQESLEALAQRLVDDTIAGAVRWHRPADTDGSWLIYSSEAGESVDVQRVSEPEASPTYVMNVYDVQSIAVGTMKQSGNDSELGRLYHAAATKASADTTHVVESLIVQSEQYRVALSSVRVRRWRPAGSALTDLPVYFILIVLAYATDLLSNKLGYSPPQPIAFLLSFFFSVSLVVLVASTLTSILVRSYFEVTGYVAQRRRVRSDPRETFEDSGHGVDEVIH